eukprot:764989-Hanusia_phi.AAC.2
MLYPCALMLLCISFPTSTGFLAAGRLSALFQAAPLSGNFCGSRHGSILHARSRQTKLHPLPAAGICTPRGKWLSMQETQAGTLKDRAMSPPIDYTTLFALSEEVKAYLPMKFDKAFQTSPTQVALRFLDASAEGGEGSRYLLLNWHPRYGRIAISEEEPGHLKASAFSSLVEDNLRDRYLSDVLVSPFTRLLRLDFTDRKPSDTGEEGMDDISEDEVFSVEGLYDENSESLSEGSDGEFRRASEGGSEGQGVDKEETAVEIAVAPMQSKERVVSSLYLQLMFRGETRVVLVDEGGRVVSTAPGTDKKGDVWSKVGKKYMEPGDEVVRCVGGDARGCKVLTALVCRSCRAMAVLLAWR